MRKIGYARVSSTHQNLDRQGGALRAERVNVIFGEKTSGKTVKGSPKLEKAIDELGKAMCWSWPSGTAALDRCSMHPPDRTTPADRAPQRMAAGESCGAIGKTMGVHHATIAQVGRLLG